MLKMRHAVLAMVTAALCAAPEVTRAEEWPMWGRTPARNMVAATGTFPMDFNPSTTLGDTDEIDTSKLKHVRWVAKLGSQTYGNPTIANGRVLVGTNNESPRDPKFEGDHSVVMSFDEKTGEFLWQLAVPKMEAGKVSDWEYLGICSSPAIEGDRAYFITNRCELVCVDLNGMANGNQGFQDEGKYFAAGRGELPVGPKDADIIWIYDMREELGIFPHNVTSSSPVIIGDTVYVSTSNGVDWSHINIPNPNAPVLIGVNKHTGELEVEEASGSSARLLHANWSSPTFGKVGDREMIFYGGGDGFMYGFDRKPVKDDDGLDVFKEIWRMDANPPEFKEYRGRRIPYAHRLGPSEIIATPVLYEGKLYVGTGQDPEHGDGVAIFHCIDPSKEGAFEAKDAVWSFKMGRTISTASVHEGLVYIAEYSGKLHCLDAKTGAHYWTHDTRSHIWGSTLVVDGKVLIGNEEGILTILETGKELKVLREVKFSAPIYTSPVIANNTLYIGTQTHLYAIAKDKE